jgi:hypothetical protein
MQPSYRLDDAALLAGCEAHVLRSSGPGGQHAQRTASAVRLQHRATGLVVQCQDHRERLRNRQVALAHLRVLLATVERGRSQADWIDALRQRGPLPRSAASDAYPTLVALALDALDGQGGSLAAAARQLGVSTRRLVQWLTADKRVHAAALELRAAHGQTGIGSA